LIIIKQTSALIGLLAGFQVVVLLVGVALFAQWMTGRMFQLVRNQVLQDNQQIAAQMAGLIEQLQPTDLRRGSEDWETLQSAIEKISLPNDGFLCIIGSESGELLCHPELRRQPEMMSPAMAPLNQVSGPAIPIIKAEGTGWAIMPDGSHLIAVHDMPQQGIRVLAHQREAGLLQATTSVIGPIQLGGSLVAVILSSIVCLGGMAIVSRYENRLAHINLHLEDLVKTRTKSLVKTRNAVIFGLAKLAESRDTDTGEHLDRIRVFSMLLASELKKSDRTITKEFIETLGLASSLHDIGKVGIPDKILLKPGRFDAEERAIMETHAQLGAECLSAIGAQLAEDDFLSMAHEIALWHHEKFDGTGYPTRIAGETIPLSARIVAVADVYDALISPRVYKRPMSHEQAVSIILKDSGSHFDPQVVAAFQAVEIQFRLITRAFHESIDAMSNFSPFDVQQSSESRQLCKTSHVPHKSN
jgi:response regulator RpfG family c-di-GMP phosphodiesterase